MGAGLLVLAATAALAVDVSRQRAHAEAVVWAQPARLTQPTDRPTLVRFTADWCPPCQIMKREVFNRPDVAAEIEQHYRAVSVDMTRLDADARALAARHGVLGIPTFVVLAPDGRETARLPGPADAAGFTAFLERAATPAPPRTPTPTPTPTPMPPPAP